MLLAFVESDGVSELSLPGRVAAVLVLQHRHDTLRSPRYQGLHAIARYVLNSALPALRAASSPLRHTCGLSRVTGIRVASLGKVPLPLPVHQPYVVRRHARVFGGLGVLRNRVRGK